MPRTRSAYPPEFRREAVELVRCRLADPQAGMDERGNQRAAAGRTCLGLRVEFGGCVDHRDDLLGRVDEDGPLPLRLQARAGLWESSASGCDRGKIGSGGSGS